MKRRQVLLSTAAVISGMAGCSGESPEDATGISEESPSETSSPAETPTTTRETPPADFAKEWTLDADDDWTERRRLTEYPDSDEAVDWTPDYARTAEYVHVPSREALASVINASDVPPVLCAVSSKWALPAEFSGTPVDLVANVRDWFGTRFDECGVSVAHPENVDPGVSELDSGREIGWDRYVVKGDTGRLDAPFQAIVDGESVEVKRVRYEAGGLLLGLLGPEKHVGFFAGGGWPSEDSAVLHTVENGEKTVSATVGGESWGVKDSLVGVLNDVEQN